MMADNIIQLDGGGFYVFASRGDTGVELVRFETTPFGERAVGRETDRIFIPTEELRRFTRWLATTGDGEGA